MSDRWENIDLDFDVDPVFARSEAETRLESDDIFATVQEAREAFWRGAESSKGAVCPVCDKKGKVYPKRTITKAMANVLCEMRQLRLLPSSCTKWGHIDGDGKQWVHVDKYLNQLGVPNNEHSDFPKLRYWGFLESARIARPDGSKRSGYWRITEAGMRFAAGMSTAHRYAREYNKQCLELWGEKITIREVKGFHFNELMGGKR